MNRHLSIIVNLIQRLLLRVFKISVAIKIQCFVVCNIEVRKVEGLQNFSLLFDRKISEIFWRELQLSES